MKRYDSTPSFFRINKLIKISSLSIVVIISSSIPAFSASQITLDTNKTSYAAGDTISIHGQVAGSPNQLVAVQVKDPNGNTVLIRTVKTDSQGNFSLEFKLSQVTGSGSYNIIASAKIQGSTVTDSKAITAVSVVPEFPLSSGLVFLVAIISVISIAGRLEKLKF